MPIQADPAKPVIQVNELGQRIAAENNGAVPTKQVDMYNKPIRPETADVLADYDRAHTKEDTSAAPTPTPEPETKEAKPINPEAETRKLFLQAQKAERKAKEMEKKAKASLDKAEAFDQAVEASKKGEDPTAILRAAGLDEVKFYQDMTKYALSEKGKAKTIEDPVQKELREHRERLDKYAADLEVQANTIKEREDLAAANKTITDQVIPLLQANPDKYEALFTEYGPNAAVEVFRACLTQYELINNPEISDEEKPERLSSFEEMADFMEDYWTKQIDSGLIAASKLKKFASRFAQQAVSQDKTPDKPETSPSRFTLSNKQSSPVSTTKTKELSRLDFGTRDEWIEYVLKQRGFR